MRWSTSWEFCNLWCDHIWFILLFFVRGRTITGSIISSCISRIGDQFIIICSDIGCVWGTPHCIVGICVNCGLICRRTQTSTTQINSSTAFFVTIKHKCRMAAWWIFKRHVCLRFLALWSYYCWRCIHQRCACIRDCSDRWNVSTRICVGICVSERITLYSRAKVDMLPIFNLRRRVECFLLGFIYWLSLLNEGILPKLSIFSIVPLVFILAFWCSCIISSCLISCISI